MAPKRPLPYRGVMQMEQIQAARACARKLIAVCLSGQVDLDWQETRRLADTPQYRILPQLEKLVAEVANELGKPNPYHS